MKIDTSKLRRFVLRGFPVAGITSATWIGKIPARHTVNTSMKLTDITTAQVKVIRTELAKLKPEKITLDGNRSLTVKEAVFALALTLERMKKRGFDTQELAEKLHGKWIEVSPATLAKYLSEFRRRNKQKTDRLAPQKRTEIACGTHPDSAKDRNRTKPTQ